jgi:hypothetical protein
MRRRAGLRRTAGVEDLDGGAHRVGEQRPEGLPQDEQAVGVVELPDVMANTVQLIVDQLRAEAAARQP